MPDSLVKEAAGSLFSGDKTDVCKTTKPTHEIITKGLAGGAQDPRVTRAESVAIFNNIPHKDKKMAVYETAKHESLYKREPQKWKREIKSFLLHD